MDDRPRCAQRWRFVWPNANEVGIGITKKTCELGDPHMVRCCSHLDEGIIAADRSARSFQRFAHKKRTRGCRRTRERDQVEAGESLSPRWYSVFSEIALRRIEREADLSKFAADKVRSSRARKSDGEIGVATCNTGRRWRTASGARSPLCRARRSQLGSSLSVPNAQTTALYQLKQYLDRDRNGCCDAQPISHAGSLTNIAAALPDVR
jgi:hypothetical protein